MNKLLAVIVGIFLYGNVIAQEKAAVKPTTDANESTYCVVLKDGNLMVLSEGKQVYQDIALEDGVVLRADDKLVNKEGKTTALLNGDCVGKDGKIVAVPKKGKENK